MSQVQVDGQLRTQTVNYDDFGNVTRINGSTRLTAVNSLTNRLTSGSYDAGGNLTDVDLDGETFKYTFNSLNMMKYLQRTTS